MAADNWSIRLASSHPRETDPPFSAIPAQDFRVARFKHAEAQPLRRAVMASVSHSNVQPVSASLAADWLACSNERETRSVIGHSLVNHSWEGGVPKCVRGRVPKRLIWWIGVHLEGWARGRLGLFSGRHQCREQTRIWDRAMIWACAFRSWQHHPARGWAEEDTECLFCHCQQHWMFFFFYCWEYLDFFFFCLTGFMICALGYNY